MRPRRFLSALALASAPGRNPRRGRKAAASRPGLEAAHYKIRRHIRFVIADPIPGGTMQKFVIRQQMIEELGPRGGEDGLALTSSSRKNPAKVVSSERGLG